MTICSTIITCLILYLNGNLTKPGFEAQIIDDSISIGYGLALDDVDGDGKPDILLADKKQFVWYRNGDWKRFVMIDSLTPRDNVCIAARDLDGDGKVEVAVGAQWNPGETSNDKESGSVHYLIRPADVTRPWKAVQLYHEPTVHRMQWVKLPNGKFVLVVAPLHGRGNKNGEGEGVKVLAYHLPKDVYSAWKIDTLDQSMHLTHNFHVIENKNTTELYLAGKEGVKILHLTDDISSPDIKASTDKGAGEVRVVKMKSGGDFIVTVEPMHGNELVIYPGSKMERVLLDDNINEGHALAAADLLNNGSDQVLAGWRAANKDGKVGIKLYYRKDAKSTAWESSWVDENEMACEDLKIMDMNADGKPDIVAAGRATHNLKIYWSK